MRALESNRPTAASTKERRSGTLLSRPQPAGHAQQKPAGPTSAGDLAGFGRTPPLGRGSTVAANRELLGRFIDAVVGEPAVLVGNSMGGSISILQSAAEPEASQPRGDALGSKGRGVGPRLFWSRSRA